MLHSIYDLNHDGIIDVRDRLVWIQSHYVPDKVVSITIVNEEQDLLSELDINKDGVVTSDEMAYWINRYDINRNGILEEFEISRALT